MISRQQRDVNRSPDPVLKITAIASSRACDRLETFSPTIVRKFVRYCERLRRPYERCARLTRDFHVGEHCCRYLCRSSRNIACRALSSQPIWPRRRCAPDRRTLGDIARISASQLQALWQERRVKGLWRTEKLQLERDLIKLSGKPARARSRKNPHA